MRQATRYLKHTLSQSSEITIVIQMLNKTKECLKGAVHNFTTNIVSILLVNYSAAVFFV